jgi:hypothetical protein
MKRILTLSVKLSWIPVVVSAVGLYAAQPCIGLDCVENKKDEAGQITSQKASQTATVRGILANPGLFDGKNVHITGQISSIEQQPSRHGNIYLVITVSDFNAPNRHEQSLKIFAFMWPRLQKGDAVVVEGTYHMDYWFGGWPSENFIDAEIIKRESIT